MLRAFTLSFLLLFGNIALHAGQYVQKQGITILASHGMDNSISLLAREFSAAEGMPVTVIFGTPSELKEQVLAGAAADVLIVEDASVFDALQLQGIIDASSRAVIAEDHVVLAAPEKSYIRQGLAQEEMPIAALFELSLPVYADPNDSYQGSVIERALQVYVPESVLANRSIKSSHAQHSRTLVLEGNNPGFVYSNALFGASVQRALFALEGSNVAFEAAIVAGEHMHLGRRWLAFAQSEHAHTLLEDMGFMIP